MTPRGPDPTDPAAPMKPLELSVLLVLAEGSDYGYGIVKRIAGQEAGGIRLAPSNLYYVLDRMMSAGWVEETEGVEDASPPDAPRRRYYRITPPGRRALAAEANRLARIVGTAKRLRLIPGGET